MNADMHIFFDVDGVLIRGFHTNPELRNRWDQNLYNDFGINNYELTERFFQDSFLDVIIGKRDLYEALEEALLQLSDKRPAETDKLVDYWFKNDSELFIEIIEAIKFLVNKDNLSLYIATNQEHYRARYLWEDLEFKNYFKEIFYSARMGCLKEDPAFFKKINEYLGLDGQNVLFFDDSPNNLPPAQQAGWQTVLVRSPDDMLKNPVIQSLIK